MPLLCESDASQFASHSQYVGTVDPSQFSVDTLPLLLPFPRALPMDIVVVSPPTRGAPGETEAGPASLHGEWLRVIAGIDHAPWQPLPDKTMAPCLLYLALRTSPDQEKATLAPPSAERLIGYVAAVYYAVGSPLANTTEGYINSIVVGPQHRGAGVAGRLLQYVVDDAKGARGAIRMRLHVWALNPHSAEAGCAATLAARRLYARFGFQVRLTKYNYYGPGEHAEELVLDFLRPSRDRKRPREADSDDAKTFTSRLQQRVESL